MKRTLLLMLGACTQQQQHYRYPAFEDMPTSLLTPVSSGAAFSTQWEAQVAEGSDEWNASVGPLGCPTLFRVGPHGHPVNLVPRAYFPYPAEGGETPHDGGFISVMMTSVGGPNAESKIILLHELGHAIGLDHADPAYGPSIMTSYPASDIQPRDVDAAACAITCGPCDAATAPNHRP